MIFSSRILYAILFYILLLTIIYLNKPSMVFNENGSFKSFGLNNDDTLYSIGTLSVILSIVSFYIFALIDYIFNH